jgi:hypothetical protein
MKMARDKVFDKLFNPAGFQKGENVRPYLPLRISGKSPKLPVSWEEPWKVNTHVNHTVHRIQQHASAKRIAVHLESLALYVGDTRDEQP